MVSIITVVENTSRGGLLKAEHGLSFLIEKDGELMLFDTGQSDAILWNCDKLGIDLSSVEYIVLSHGHYDHVGGLEHILEFSKPEIVAHPEIFRERYARTPTGDMRYIGIKKREFYESRGAKFIFDDRPREVMDGIFTSGFEPMATDFESVDRGFVYRDGDVYRPDDVPDDMSLVIETERGLFVVFGCAHRGIINIINHVENVFGRKVFGFVGGTHLGPAPTNQKEKTIVKLRDMGLEVIAPLHCTGLAMACRLYREFGNRVVFANVGSTIEF